MNCKLVFSLVFLVNTCFIRRLKKILTFAEADFVSSIWNNAIAILDYHRNRNLCGIKHLHAKTCFFLILVKMWHLCVLLRRIISLEKRENNTENENVTSKKTPIVSKNLQEKYKIINENYFYCPCFFLSIFETFIVLAKKKRKAILLCLKVCFSKTRKFALKKKRYAYKWFDLLIITRHYMKRQKRSGLK